MPEYLRPILNEIHTEILDRFYGCGSPIPSALEGATLLDLGCGTGRDAYMLAKLVGPNGRVIGLDMTDEQLDVARRHIDYHMKKFGYASPNVDFREGFMEDLAAAGIADNSIDLVVSNCVINLSPNKEKVFSEILRVLKPSGELYFSDVFCRSAHCRRVEKRPRTAR
jgi:arsenite methyltransferase